MAVRYPEIKVTLARANGDQDSIPLIVTVRQALREAGKSEREIDTFTRDAVSGDFDRTLGAINAWVSVEWVSNKDKVGR